MPASSLMVMQDLVSRCKVLQNTNEAFMNINEMVMNVNDAIKATMTAVLHI